MLYGRDLCFGCFFLSELRAQNAKSRVDWNRGRRTCGDNILLAHGFGLMYIYGRTVKPIRSNIFFDRRNDRFNFFLFVYCKYCFYKHIR